MIEGKVISLRPLERRHLERTLAWANDPKLMLLLNRAQPITAAEHEAWFASISEKSDRRYFSIELNEVSELSEVNKGTHHGGAHIGNVWLWDIDPRHRRAELRIVIGDEAATGQGVGTEAISLLCDYAFAELNLHKIYAYVLAINPRARRSFEKAGFTLEGTLREDRWTGDGYTDVFFLGKLQGCEGENDGQDN